MRRNCRHKELAVLLLLAAACWPACAARHITVEQLRQSLDQARSSHKSDNAVAKQLEDTELSEWLTPPTLQQFLATSPGPRSAKALQILADLSAFLSPPKDEIPSRPIPNLAAQRAIISQTIRYVGRTLPTLPDFLATRETAYFDDSLRSANPDKRTVASGMHFVAHEDKPIAFRDGRETDDPFILTGAKAEKGSAANRQNESSKKQSAKPVSSSSWNGLTSWGEFGPILGIILIDAAKGKLTWSHWEQVNGKPLAVFQLSVDRSASHYTIRFQDNDRVERPAHIQGLLSELKDYQNQESEIESLAHGRTTAYHGSLAVDPEDSTIRRIVMEADLRPQDPVQHFSMVVEYGPVQIGSGTYVCPTHSVAESRFRVSFRPTSASTPIEIAELHLNDVEYTNYRRFGSEATLVTSIPPDTAQGRPATGASAGATGEAPEPALADAQSKSENAPEHSPSSSTPEAQPESASSTSLSAAGIPPADIRPDLADEEVLLHSVNGIPGLDEAVSGPDAASPNQPVVKSPSDGAFTLQVSTRLVDLGLVATDKRGKPVTDLRPDEIEIYDNGRKQQLRAFHHPAASTTSSPSSVLPSQSTDSFTNIDSFTNTPSAATATDAAPDTFILLLDESHLAFQDLNRARDEVLRFLASAPPSSRMALYSISEHGFHVLQDITSDHSAVIEKLTNWRPSAVAVSQAQTLDRRNNRQFDTVHHFEDLANVNGNRVDAPETMNSTDPELREMGANPLRAALEGMVALARHFAPVPGHKSLVWISGDSTLYDYADQAVGTEKTSKVQDAAILHTREALNEAHASLYAVDASAVQTGAVSAELENQNVMLNPTSPAYSKPEPATRDNGNGRIAEQMLQNTRAIQGPVRLLAESTGGRAINKGSDLKSTLDSIGRESTSLYELTFSPDTQADGKFHTVLIKVPSRKDIKLRYRTGYLYAEQASDNKQRLTQAIWSPQDLTAISLTAEAFSATDSATGKDTIKLRIGFPGLAFKSVDSGGSLRWSDQLYIFLAQRDDASQTAKVDGDTLRLSLLQATYDSGMPAGIPYQHAIEPAKNLGSVRIIVVDGNSGKMGSVTLPDSAFHP